MNYKNKIQNNFEYQPFHLANLSPWPLYTSILTFQFLLSTLLFFHNYKGSVLSMYFSTLLLCYVILNWFRNIIVESTYQGNHTKKVQSGIKMGMLLFITSEIMLFFSFFWTFFHSSLAPSIWIGSIWPPVGIEIINLWHLPLLNTIILLSSGISLTWSHRALVGEGLQAAITGLVITIAWGVFFTFLQYTEYNNTYFSINDSVYGSIFFLLTGFHGFHVLLGTVLLIGCLIRLLYSQLMSSQHVGYECSIWYWHFVDIVWIFLYILIYCWGC